jgi:hypothetical protein
MHEILKTFGITAVKTADIWPEGIEEFSKEVFSDSNKLFCGSAFNKWHCTDSINYLIKWNPSLCSV